jgi:hypothetical protein
MKTIFVANCPRCLKPLHRAFSNGVEIHCKCGYLLNSIDSKIECSYYYRGYFIFSSERIGETAFHPDDGNDIKWIKKVLDPLITNEKLDKILLLI